MTGEIVHLNQHALETDPSVGERLQPLLAIVRAINAGELLEAFPECDIARVNHKTALSLLSILERELIDLCDSLEN